jgi:hypothetical protein
MYRPFDRRNRIFPEARTNQLLTRALLHLEAAADRA